ncbi:hypothetical protein M5689_000571 [Euphorbia peplus]|nr:hypothetical protein M5689_000571 [Euphorbia peplus]
MGLMGFIFKFSLECFGILAWPLFAICYPLCASIQSIETNANFDTEKLITYWVCFSLILLFENAFQQLLQWLPYWPYMKLIIVGCLVTPHFDGSLCVYNHFVRPCLSMNPRFVFNWFIKLSEILKQDYLLTVANRESKEIQPEALQNQIVFKPMFEDFKVQEKDMNAVEITEKNGLSPTKPVRQTEFDFALPRTYAQIAAIPIGGRKDVPDLIASKKLQKELTCATSQADLISQLTGKIHMNLVSAETGSETSDSKSCQELWTCVLCKVKCMRKLSLISHFQGQRHAKALESLKSRPNAQFYFKPSTCGICQKILKNKHDLIAHFQSKRHLDACELQKVEEMSGNSEVASVSLEHMSNLPECEAMNLKSRSIVELRDCKWWCTICDVSCSCEENMKYHLYGSKHLARILELGDALANVQAARDPTSCELDG